MVTMESMDAIGSFTSSTILQYPTMNDFLSYGTILNTIRMEPPSFPSILVFKISRTTTYVWKQ